MKKFMKKNQGITLLALVITIVVLVILVGVSYKALVGEDGIITQASDSKQKSEKAYVIELGKADIDSVKAKNKDDRLTKNQLKTILDKYFEDVGSPDDWKKSLEEMVLTTKGEYGNYKIAVSELYDEVFKKEREEIVNDEETYFFKYIKNDDSVNIVGFNLKALDYRIADLSEYQKPLIVLKLDIDTLTIPEKIEGLPVTKVSFGNDITEEDGNASAYHKIEGINKIVYPNTCKTIENGKVFVDTKEVTLPEGVELIDSSAFNEWENLYEITIPATVTKISDEAFASCNNLKTVICNGDTEIGNSAFKNCEKLEAIKVSNTIGTRAFEGCENLSSVNIANNGKRFSIGNYAFRECYSLSSIVIPSNIDKIGTQAFASCEELKDLKIEEGVIEIGNEAFMNCWQDYCIGEDTKCELILPTSITTVGRSAFAYCTKNLTIKISESTDTSKWSSTWYGKATVIKY